MTRRGHKGQKGPGRLTLAWAGLVAVLGLGAAGILALPEPTDAPDAEIRLAGTPEVFANSTTRPGAPAADTALIAPVSLPEPSPEAAQMAEPDVDEKPLRENVETIIEPGGAKRIILPGASKMPAPVRTETPSPDPQVSTPEDAMVAEGRKAAVITVTDMGKKPNLMAEVQSAPPPGPDSRYYTRTVDGWLPKPAADGTGPSKVYRRTFHDPAGRPKLAIIVGGLGLDRELTRRAITELPSEVSLAFAPYGKGLEQWAMEARASGHELLLELPMEKQGMPAGHLGPAAILASHSPPEIAERLNWTLSRYPGYVGVTNYFGNAIAGDRLRAALVTSKLRDSGIALFADPEFSRPEIMKSVSDSRNILAVIAPGSGDLTGQLDHLAAGASRSNPVLVKVYVTGETLPQLVAWSKNITSRDLVLAPASALLP